MGEILSHPIQDVASHDPVTIDEGATLRGAARQLWSANIGAAVVLRDDRPVGILSERDIVAHLAKGADPATFTAGEAMTPQFLIAEPTDRVLSAVIDMIDRGIRHLPLFDDAHRCVGMVSMRDLLRPMLIDALEAPVATRAP
jgi:CBS domain-containing protein